MKIITQIVHPNEPCYGLVEQPMMCPRPDDSRQWRWVQSIRVIRGDAIAYYETDLGPAGNFEDVPPLFVPSFGDDSVAALQELAQAHRQDDRWAKRKAEIQAESTFIRDVLREQEELLEVKSNRSHFGPKHKAERDGFPAQTVTRKLKEQRDERRGYKKF